MKMADLLQDLRYALRTLLRAPAFALVAVATLALGIGANTAIFSVVDALLLRPLPYPGSERIMLVEQTRLDGRSGNLSYPDYVDLRDQQTSFSELAALHDDFMVLTGQGEPQRLAAVVVSANYLRALGVTPALGRDLAAGEDTAGRNHVALLTHSAWTRRFAGDPTVVGRAVTLDDTPHTIVGVLPAWFHVPGEDTGYDVIVPMPRPLDAGLISARSGHYLSVIGRLAAGVGRDRAEADLRTIAARLAATYPDSDAERSARVVPLHDALVKDVRPALLLLLGAVGFVLLIACVNVANILLARATVRQRELAIRFALGASRARVLRQLLTESIVLAMCGGAVGVVLAMWGLDALRSVLPLDVVRMHTLAVDGRILVFTLFVSVATGLIFGLLPALHAASGSPSDALKDGARATSGARQRVRGALVAVEIAVALLLLVGAGVTLRSFRNLTHVDPGFNPRDLITSELALPETRYGAPEKIARFYTALQERLAAIPGVQAVAIGIPLPYTNANIGTRFQVVGRPAPQAGHENVTGVHAVNAGFFAALEIPLVRGRAFTAADDVWDGPRVAVVNQTFARQYFDGVDPIGQRVALSFQTLVEDKPLEIVGVIADTRPNGLSRAPAPELYAPYPLVPLPYVQIAARTTAGAGFEAALRRAVAEIDAAQPIGDVGTMKGSMDATLAKERLSTWLLGLFGAVALALAIVGVYGVMSYMVTQRTGEIGIRLALGARPADVTRMVVRQGLGLAAAGIVVGVAGALALGRLIAGMLFGVSAADPTTVVAAAVVLLGVAVVASWLPARRAARVDPMIALRAP
jgi:putative ABC transport system permease protein